MPGVYLSVHLSVCLSICLSVYSVMTFSKGNIWSLCLGSVHPPVCLSIYLSVCPVVALHYRTRMPTTVVFIVSAVRSKAPLCPVSVHLSVSPVVTLERMSLLYYLHLESKCIVTSQRLSVCLSLCLQVIRYYQSFFQCFAVMSKSVRPKDLTDKISFGLTKKKYFCYILYCSDWQNFKNQSKLLTCPKRFQHLWSLCSCCFEASFICWIWSLGFLL